MAKRKVKPNGQPRQADGVAAGVSQTQVVSCRNCGAHTRPAVLTTGQQMLVDAVPVETITHTGEPLVMFTPHAKTCKNPQRLHLPGGQVKVL